MTNATILIVEDEISVAENIRKKLEQLGYSVSDIVSSGEQAIRRIREGCVDLVLMDIELEGEMDGIETAEQIRAECDIPIIYLTAHADDEILRRARITGPFAYLLKPLHIKELHSNIAISLYRHSMEKMLKISEARYRRITDTITDYIYTVQIQDGKVCNTYHSPACLAVTGYTDKEFQGNPHLWIEMVYPEDIPVVLAHSAQLLAGNHTRPLEHRIIRKDGTNRWVKNTPVLHHNPAGVLVAYDGIIRDITERKEHELALKEERASLAQCVEERTYELRKANAELAQAARMKDEFLATMSHELRTPLHTILGMTEALQEETFGPLTEKQQNALRSVMESGQHLLSLIGDILDLAKIGAGKFELNFFPVSIEAVCQASLRFITQEALKKHIMLSFSLKSKITTIEADNRRLKQILVNLLSNAVKFTPEGGEVGLEVRSDPGEQHLYFTVWDTGIGITPENLNRLFHPFVQLDGTFSRKHPGTGLGLSLVSRIVDLFGGSITVESEPDKGSRFTVSLPYQDVETSPSDDDLLFAPSQAEEALSYESDDETFEGCRPLVLLAEDQEPNIELLANYLESKGYDISVARDGKEAVERTLAEHPAIILMDIQMPEMDGLEAVQQIRKWEYGLQHDHSEGHEPRSRIPIIALTALAMPGDRQRCLEAGVDEYMSKPVNLRRLTRILDQLVQ